jgi:hypothetical protein
MPKFKVAPERLRALRDRLNIKGRSELNFEEKVKAISEIVSAFTFRAGFDLFRIRQQLVKLKTRHPDLAEPQKVLLAELEARFTKRETMIKTRAEKKRKGEPIYHVAGIGGGRNVSAVSYSG